MLLTSFRSLVFAVLGPQVDGCLYPIELVGICIFGLQNPPGDDEGKKRQPHKVVISNVGCVVIPNAAHPSLE